ncbi:tumor necrosis factor receptor superfamily member 19L isoform X1 [Crotalus tigris]|uniref:tumor necrosis factor receptor superfamily member 19L isoform X1 n=1 Tax=Crotalus tigris TaxID=88082 RepID=UPI00192F800F|nr:tumor necrosis factor receptor superfamily member 19L isoform X1 [Crotalus tigris]
MKPTSEDLSASPVALKVDKMKRHPDFCWAISLLTALCWHPAWAQACGGQEYRGADGRCVLCQTCPAGEEPDRKCGYGAGLGMACKPCPAGSFSPTSGLGFCSLHTPCEAKKRVHLHIGTATADTWCGACLPGYYSPEGETDPRSPCLPCLAAPSGVSGCQGSRKPPARLSRNAEAPPRRGEKTALNGTRDGKPDDSATQYAVLAIVPVFCIMGLLGILFCNLLMKKGYHCTAQKETDEEAAKSDRTGNSSGYKTEDLNEDTIGVLVRLITEKKRKCSRPRRDAEGVPQQATHPANLQACEQVASPAPDPPHLPASAPPPHHPGPGHALGPQLHPLQPDEVAGDATVHRGCVQPCPAGGDHHPLRGQVPRGPYPRAESQPHGTEDHLRGGGGGRAQPAPSPLPRPRAKAAGQPWGETEAAHGGRESARGCHLTAPRPRRRSNATFVDAARQERLPARCAWAGPRRRWRPAGFSRCSLDPVWVGLCWGGGAGQLQRTLPACPETSKDPRFWRGWPEEPLCFTLSFCTAQRQLRHAPARPGRTRKKKASSYCGPGLSGTVAPPPRRAGDRVDSSVSFPGQPYGSRSRLRVFLFFPDMFPRLPHLATPPGIS